MFVFPMRTSWRVRGPGVQPFQRILRRKRPDGSGFFIESLLDFEIGLMIGLMHAAEASFEFAEQGWISDHLDRSL
jgi:hypothetical protein